MKKLFTLLCLLVLSCSSMAQLRLALLGGPHSASVKETNDIPGWDASVKPLYSNRGGLNLGVLAEIPLNASGRLFLQPGLMYMSKGRKYQQVNDTAQVATDTLSTTSKFFTNYIDIPVYVTYKLPLGKKSFFFAGAGPYLGLFYNGKQSTEVLQAESDNSLKYNKEESDIEVGNAPKKAKTIDYGFNIRGGFELGNFILSGFYSQGLNNFYTASYDGTFKHQVVGASIGFWLTKATPVTPKKPKDTDGDGIADDKDECPTLAGPELTKGCPDRDGDGLADSKDKCPDLPGQLAYQGCPIPDTDGDGVNDHDDACPQEAGPASNKGCPLPKPEPDSDGDGVIDKEDKCPNEAGDKAHGGCPVIKQEVIEKVNYAARQILFSKGSDKLVASSHASLNEVVEILKKEPGIRLNIDGYTDNTGSAVKNVLLSQLRADAVKKYLMDRGIESIRLSSLGHGSEKPIADNSTEEGRVKNRRVELTLDKR